MLGLQRGSVKLVSHCPHWAHLFTQERSRLRAALGEKVLDIQHIGSTAVPGLDAKPILDIAVAVADLSIVAECVPALKSLGYSYFGDRGEKGDHFFARGAEQHRTHYIHLLLHSGTEWSACLRFRDHLTACPEARQRYSRLKHRLSEQYESDRQSYTEGKAALIQSILREASGGSF